MALLPPEMDSMEAEAQLFAIGLQESRLKHRRQIGGPARGFWQFEHGGGVRGVLFHPQTRGHIRAVLSALSYDDSVATSYEAIEHNDLLACAFARLLLWTLPQPLPTRGESASAWQQYLDAWRPGKPHPAKWEENFAQGWKLADERLA